MFPRKEAAGIVDFGVAASGAQHHTEDTSVDVSDSLVLDATAAEEFQTPGLAVGPTVAVGFEGPASGGFEAALVALAYAPCKAVGVQEGFEPLAAFELWMLELQWALHVAENTNDDYIQKIEMKPKNGVLSIHLVWPFLIE